MLIVEVMGGLGNQLQQYALYRKLKSMGREAKLDVSWYTKKERQEGVLAPRSLELSYFNDLPMDICTEAEKTRLAGGEGLGGKLRRKLAPGTVRHFWETDLYHPEIFSFTDMYLTGFWACEKYYADILPQLRKEIVFPSSEEVRNCRTISEMKQNMSVSIHIRRGDYLEPGLCPGTLSGRTIYGGGLEHRGQQLLRHPAHEQLPPQYLRQFHLQLLGRAP